MGYFWGVLGNVLGVVLVCLLGTGFLTSCDCLEETPDYSKDSCWLALPEDPDEYDVDIFWVFPTIYQGEDLADISDGEYIAGAEVTLRTQASVFKGNANIYSPLYRQLGRAGFANTDTMMSQLAIGESDVEAALRYYLEHYNNGKPFFIAGHSQGSSTLGSLLTKIWGTTGAEDRLIAAYLIGFSVTEDDIATNPNIRMCESATDTGCFISYNSIADGAQENSVQILPGAIVTNPLSWVSSSSDSARVDASEHLGAVFFDDDGYFSQYYPSFCSAQILGNGLVCELSDPSVVDADDGIYHRYDYSLFYENLRENVATRIDAFVATQE